MASLVSGIACLVAEQGGIMDGMFSLYLADNRATVNTFCVLGARAVRSRVH